MFGAGKKTIVRIEFPTNQILKILFILSLFVLLLKLRQVIILLFLSFILMASIKPAVILLNSKLRMPKGISVFLIYLAIFLFFGLSIYFISKPLATELRTFIESFPTILENTVHRFSFLEGKVDTSAIGDSLMSTISSADYTNIGSYVQNALSFTFTAFGFVVQAITVIIISVYMLLERDTILNFIIRVFKFDHDKFHHVYDKIETQLGAWVRGQILLGLLVGIFTWIGLTILGIKFALPLAFLSGLLEIVPIIGPIVATIPITLIGLSISPVKGILSLGLSTLIQQAEGHFLVPTVMKRAVGLSSVVTLVSLLVGSQLLGLVGSIVAVPLAAMISVLINSYLEYRELE